MLSGLLLAGLTDVDRSHTECIDFSVHFHQRRERCLLEPYVPTVWPCQPVWVSWVKLSHCAPGWMKNKDKNLDFMEKAARDWRQDGENMCQGQRLENMHWRMVVLPFMGSYTGQYHDPQQFYG